MTGYGIHNSTMFANEKVRSIAGTKNVTYNEHIKGIHPEVFLADPEVSEMFVITSVNADRNGVMFVSSFEARDTDLYPFFGVSLCTHDMLCLYSRSRYYSKPFDAK